MAFLKEFLFLILGNHLDVGPYLGMEMILWQIQAQNEFHEVCVRLV